jgi:purine-binding chemotaxis protein CheW
MPERPEGSTSREGRFVVFAVGGRSLALPAERVREIVRVPPLQRVPQAPRGLVGLMNLRGTVVPVVDITGQATLRPDDGAGRILIVEAGAPLGLLTERVTALARGRFEPSDDTTKGGFSDGLARLQDGSAAHVVGLDRLLAEMFPQFGRRPARAATDAALGPVQAAGAGDTVPLVTFDVSGQAFALPIERVDEIIPVPERLATVPGPDEHVLGVVPLREDLLAVVSAARLLRLPPEPASRTARIVVTRVGATRAGILVDQVRSITRVEERMIDRVPALLRSEGAEIQAICRLDGGSRLVSVLSTEGMFNEVVMGRIAAEQGHVRTSDGTGPDLGNEGEQFVVFRVGEDLFGLPVGTVEEVVRAPETLTRLPKAPAFVEGMMNLRGAALAVIDQRRRFDLPPAPAGTNRRVIVLAADGTRAGFIVDQVTDVRRFSVAAIRPAPELTEDQARIVPRVAVAEDGNMVLLIDPRGLLESTEKRLLAAISRDQKARPAA